MGKGDIKTRRGKIVNGSYGNKRPRSYTTTTIKSVKTLDDSDISTDVEVKPKAKESKARK